MRIFFGDATTCSVPVNSGQFNEWCSNFISQQNLQSITILKQTHSTDGISITSKPTQSVTLFEQTGDYLITNQQSVAIGILTADCLPIICRDPIKNVVAIIHAGWRGSVAKITQRVLEKLEEDFDSSPENLNISFGPAAGLCCYEVSSDFFENLTGFDFYEKTLMEKNSKYYFDLKLFNKLFLQQIGLCQKNISVENSICTIENEKFYSFRRLKQRKYCNPTIAWLN